MPHAYTEDQLLDQPAIGLFAELGWQHRRARPLLLSAQVTLAERGRV
jgi:hypothetical protein